MLSIEDLREIISTHELPDIETPDDDIFGSIKISIQIIKKTNGKFYPRIMRKERIDVAPAYSHKKSKNLIQKMTIEILVPDESFDFRMIQADSSEDALLIGMKKINDVFFNK